MRVFKNSATDIAKVASLLLDGEVVAIPTETVYGLAADALNPEAVSRIFSIKGRPSNNPLIIHISEASDADTYVELNPSARQLMQAFWPGSLTLVLPKKGIIPDIVSAGLPTVGIRCPAHPAMHAILQQLGRPLAAPSANPSNYISPTRVEHVVEHLKGRLLYALDGGPCSAGVESTIVDLSDEFHPRLLRPGPILAEAIEAVLQRSLTQPAASQHKERGDSALLSPGQLPVHYSPRTPITLLSSHTHPAAQKLSRRVAHLRFSQPPTAPSLPQHITPCYLSESLDPTEAQQRLYALLQELDAAGFDHIVVDPIPSGPEWSAIRDRLTRAAAGHAKQESGTTLHGSEQLQ
jgi:L-threonylcarbamoyladenylate synthase